MADSDPAAEATTVSVTNPTQFLAAIRSGVRHVVISEHLDMTSLSTQQFSDDSPLNDVMTLIAITPNMSGGHTGTIRGNCSSAAPVDVGLLLRPGQCLVTVRQNFLEQRLPGGTVWISDLYITISRPSQESSITATLVDVAAGDMYLTDMTFAGRGERGRAVDVGESSRIYVFNTFFTRFSNDRDGVVRLAAGARATISTSTFLDNEVTGQLDGRSSNATGPVMGLSSAPDSTGKHCAAAWFWSCNFTDNRAARPGQVAVEGRSCGVFSNTADPTVWDRSLSVEVRAWLLERAEDADDADVTFASLYSRAGGLPFLRVRSSSFQQLVIEQIEILNLDLPEAIFQVLPAASELMTSDPYETAPGRADRRSTIEAGVVAGIVGAALLLIAVTAAGAWRQQRQRMRKHKEQSETRKHEAHAGGRMASPLPMAGSTKEKRLFGLQLLNQSGVMPSVNVAHSSGTTLVQVSHGHLLNGGTRDSVFTTATLSDTHEFALPPRQPPGIEASTQERLEYVQQQLETLGDQEFLNGLVAEPGPSNRINGGQAVIQFAKDRRTRLLYAVKFFLFQTAFADECRLYTNPDNPLGQFLPALRNIADGSSIAPLVVDGHGHPMPPCVVMEKGESLDVWMQRNRGGVDMITGLQVIQHVAERLADLHAAGFVHRDLKLSNVMWLPRENRWTLIDFGCAAAIGENAPLLFSLRYAPPEVVQAAQEGCRTIQAESSMDAWSLGIIAWELFCKEAALDMFEGKNVTVKRILGIKPLPWEAQAVGAQQRLHQLGRFRPAVLGLLQRDAAARLAIADFISRCRRVIEETNGPPPAKVY
eukprot:jgi/Ulvmu1/1982/UM012_0144.1